MLSIFYRKVDRSMKLVTISYGSMNSNLATFYCCKCFLLLFHQKVAILSPGVVISIQVIPLQRKACRSVVSIQAYLACIQVARLFLVSSQPCGQVHARNAWEIQGLLQGLRNVHIFHVELLLRTMLPLDKTGEHFSKFRESESLTHSKQMPFMMLILRKKDFSKILKFPFFKLSCKFSLYSICYNYAKVLRCNSKLKRYYLIVKTN